MIKVNDAKRILLISLAILGLNGCTFIVKDEQAIKYYGIDNRRGGEFLNQVLDQQQQLYRTEEVSASDKKL
ncbi:MAG: hypothetical protein PHR84_06135 [Candidatus Omnitrophica bacterium]|jgi:hypothetical protein|nr:hypothetical protein [Candidatus Omnitrophota bacterium]MDD5661459.1 hypothetical protein [Candidatus Omnitrophota bacterium]